MDFKVEILFFWKPLQTNSVSIILWTCQDRCRQLEYGIITGMYEGDFFFSFLNKYHHSLSLTHTHTHTHRHTHTHTHTRTHIHAHLQVRTHITQFPDYLSVFLFVFITSKSSTKIFFPIGIVTQSIEKKELEAQFIWDINSEVKRKSITYLELKSLLGSETTIRS